MDSLTQLTFGAACGEAVLGRKVGGRAIVWGAILGTLPDLDVFIPLGGPVNDFVYHRGFSHSLILLALLSPLTAWLITKIHPDTKRFFGGIVLKGFSNHWNVEIAENKDETYNFGGGVMAFEMGFTF